jgi:hypothetical protein
LGATFFSTAGLIERLTTKKESTMEFSEDVIIVPIVFGTMAFALKLILDYRTRSQIINKGLVDEKVKYLFENLGRVSPLNNLKWGMVLLGIGVALLFKQIAPFYVSSSSTFGLMFILAGFGFLVYYAISDKLLKKDDSAHPRP